ncbi:uncharacterized protein K441DRAFT_654492 [Cenococcum geophilum 1.58]|uniref:uncharacterized protein n=1 Tax=Cenococcum geophilum 1.58 TaxID=794803 RepID=UPI00358E75F1|nr:hypothetical protein K441DRAFT_654492 [Cenococcum geophilum 1.58]
MPIKVDYPVPVPDAYYPMTHYLVLVACTPLVPPFVITLPYVYIVSFLYSLDRQSLTQLLLICIGLTIE